MKQGSQLDEHRRLPSMMRRLESTVAMVLELPAQAVAIRYGRR
jgi:hypothetical protein